jgi:hypothetical protein
MNRGNAQSISGVHFEGQRRTAGVYGLRAFRVRGLTISNITAEGFRGPQDLGGGAVDIRGAWNLDLRDSILRNSGNANSRACTGTLGLGDIHDSKIHNLVISDDRAYAVKASPGDGRDRTRISNVDFFNLDVHVATSDCARWNTLAFELFQTDATNVVIRDSRFNSVVSLTSEAGPLSRGFRYRVHNNVFTVQAGNSYSIELDADSSVVDHNYFDGGIYPIANFTTERAVGIRIHHNVFDNQTGPTAAVHMTGGVAGARFYNNTIVLRQPFWRDGIFSLGGQVGYKGGTSEIRNNVFYSTYPIGDKLGLGLDTSIIDTNDFHNVVARGTSVLDDLELPLAGGFPQAYVPTGGGSIAPLGAFAQGTFSAGPHST